MQLPSLQYEFCISLDDLIYRRYVCLTPAARPVFDRFNWSIGRGEAWAVIGASGGGKTTLLMLVAGLRQPASGLITINMQIVDRPRPQTGLVLQKIRCLLPWATVAQNAALGLRARDYYGPDGRHAPVEFVRRPIQQRVDAWLNRLGIDAQRDMFPSQISAGSGSARQLRARSSSNPTCC